MVHQVKQTIAFGNHLHFWLKDGSSVSVGGKTHAHRVEEERVVAAWCARGYLNSDYVSRQTCTDRYK
ncbi:hypothetical protein TNCV_3630921 [Trichonephila clavipes]|nr:hypothetical protein TNCV_3630921 [Trichonephila clavipes]